jgi:hypothetical protein
VLVTAQQLNQNAPQAPELFVMTASRPLPRRAEQPAAVRTKPQRGADDGWRQY